MDIPFDHLHRYSTETSVLVKRIRTVMTEGRDYAPDCILNSEVDGWLDLDGEGNFQIGIFRENNELVVWQINSQEY